MGTVSRTNNSHLHADLDDNDKLVFSKSEVVLLLSQLSLASDHLHSVLHARELASIQHPKKNPKIKPMIINNILLITFVWQLINVGLLEIMQYEGYKDAEVMFDTGIGLMIFFQLAHLSFVIITSIKLAKQIKHTTVTSWFLGQSFLSTCLLFAGFYILIYSIHKTAFRGLSEQGVPDDSTVFLLFLKFLYFSVTTISTCGFGDIYAHSWETYLLVLVEMVIGTIYIVVIFGKGMVHFYKGNAATVNENTGLLTNSNEYQSINRTSSLREVVSINVPGGEEST